MVEALRITGCRKSYTPPEQHNLVFHTLCEVTHLPGGEIKDKQLGILLK
jgi:hypothetical protein